jgi:hypothetical protein
MGIVYSTAFYRGNWHLLIAEVAIVVVVSRK